MYTASVCVCVFVTDWCTVINKMQFIIFALIDKLPSATLMSHLCASHCWKGPPVWTQVCLPWTKIYKADSGLNRGHSAK